MAAYDDDKNRGGDLVSLFLSFCAFIGILTIILTIWVLYVIHTRETPGRPTLAPLPSSPPASAPLASSSSARPALTPLSTAAAHDTPSHAHRRRVSFKTSRPLIRPLIRPGSESSSVRSSLESSLESAAPATPGANAAPGMPSPIIVRSPGSASYAYDTFASPALHAPVPAPAPSRLKLAGLKALARARPGSRAPSRASSRPSSRAPSPEPVDRNACAGASAGAISDGETSAVDTRRRSLGSVMRSLGRRRPRTRGAETDGEDTPVPAPPPSAFVDPAPRSRRASLVARVMRRTSSGSSARTDTAANPPAPPPALDAATPESRRSSLRATAPAPLSVAALRELAARGGIERPASAPPRRTAPAPWAAPLDRHARCVAARVGADPDTDMLVAAVAQRLSAHFEDAPLLAPTAAPA